MDKSLLCSLLHDTKYISLYLTQIFSDFNDPVLKIKRNLGGILPPKTRDKWTSPNLSKLVFCSLTIFFKFRRPRPWLLKTGPRLTCWSSLFWSSSVQFLVFFWSYGLDLNTLLPPWWGLNPQFFLQFLLHLLITPIAEQPWQQKGRCTKYSFTFIISCFSPLASVCCFHMPDSTLAHWLGCLVFSCFSPPVA